MVRGVKAADIERGVSTGLGVVAIVKREVVAIPQESEARVARMASSVGVAAPERMLSVRLGVVIYELDRMVDMC